MSLIANDYRLPTKAPKEKTFAELVEARAGELQGKMSALQSEMIELRKEFVKVQTLAQYYNKNKTESIDYDYA